MAKNNKTISKNFLLNVLVSDINKKKSIITMVVLKQNQYLNNFFNQYLPDNKYYIEKIKVKISTLETVTLQELCGSIQDIVVCVKIININNPIYKPKITYTFITVITGKNVMINDS